MDMADKNTNLTNKKALGRRKVRYSTVQYRLSHLSRPLPLSRPVSYTVGVFKRQGLRSE